MFIHLSGDNRRPRPAPPQHVFAVPQSGADPCPLRRHRPCVTQVLCTHRPAQTGRAPSAPRAGGAVGPGGDAPSCRDAASAVLAPGLWHSRVTARHGYGTASLCLGTVPGILQQPEMQKGVVFMVLVSAPPPAPPSPCLPRSAPPAVLQGWK